MKRRQFNFDRKIVYFRKAFGGDRRHGRRADYLII